MSKNIYVMSDIHGHFNILKKMMKKINFCKDDTLYILGDCCDRGPNSLEIYLYIQKHPNIHLIRGNHEIMMRDALIKDDLNSTAGRMWDQNGASSTLENFNNYLRKRVNNDKDFETERKILYQKIINYVDSCPNYLEIECNNQNFLLIHAGINPDKTLAEQTEEDCAWMREYFFMSKGLDDKIIVFGHTPTCYISQNRDYFDVWFDPIFKDKIGIDGGLGGYNNGQLNCLCLNNMEVTVIKKKELGGEEDYEYIN